MTKRARGFTMIEVLVVVAIIGILTTITFMGFGRYQADVRDTARSSKAAIISEALEKYYDKNGEYPSCPSITGSATTVTTSVLPGIDSKSLVAPQADSGTTNSLACTDLTDMSQDDFFAYVGDTSSTCTSGGACLLYELKYKQESTGQIASLSSRRKTNIGSTGAPACSASVVGFTQINTSWTAVGSASSYDIVRATDSGFTANVVSQNVTNTSYSATGLAASTTYYFRVRANTAVGTGPWCNTITASTWSVGTPAPSIGTITTTSINITWPSASHATTYTAQRSTDQSNWTAGCSDIATTSCNFTGLTAGTRYYFRVMGKNGAYLGAWSSIINAVAMVNPPTGVTAVTNSSTQITASWNAVPGATSYSLQYYNTGFSNTITGLTGTSRAVTGLSQGTVYYFIVYALVGTTSSNASSAAGAVTTVDPPAWNAWGRSYSFPYIYTWVRNTAGSSLCPTGTHIYTQFRDGIYGSFWNGWGGWGSNGTSSQSLTYTSNVGSYSSTLQTEINGYCYNPTYGIASATISSGVSTASHPVPPVTLSGPVECAGAYSLRSTFHLRLRLQEVSYNLDANQSNVNWSLYRIRVATPIYYSWDQTKTWPWGVSIHGSGWSGASNSVVFRDNGSVGATEGISSGSLTVQHDANGNATIGFSGSDGPGSNIFGSASCSGAYGLSDLR